MLSFAHSGNIGDVVLSLPTVRVLGGGTFWLVPTVHMSEDFATKLSPLLASQDYISEVKIGVHSGVDYDMDKFRSLDLDLSQGNSCRWYVQAFPVCADLSKPWLTVPPDKTFAGCILVNRTNRYRNNNLSYRFLEAKKNVVFVGLEDEYRDFGGSCPSALNYEAPDFLALARAIAGCKLFIGNQSFAYTLAEGLKVPRVLEVCPHCPNAAPCGLRAWDVLLQENFETIVNHEG
jgi:hypothetical protein